MGATSSQTRPLRDRLPRQSINSAPQRSGVHCSPAFLIGHLAILAATAACAAGDGEPLVADVRFDTVAVVGGAAEQRPLLLYSSPVPQLVDDSTLVYSDADVPGRMVTVNLFTGEGWEVLSSPDADGPGEFGGSQPFISTSGGVIHTVTDALIYNAWTVEGDLIANDRYSSESWFTTGFYRYIAGMLGRLAVVLFAELPEDDLVHRSIRIYDPDLGLIAAVSDGIPGYEVRAVPGGGTSVRFQSVDEEPVTIAARGETVVWALTRQTALNVLNADGSIRGSRDMEVPISVLFIDSDERIWVWTTERDVDGKPVAIVLDRDLRILFRALDSNFVDASGDHVLAFLPQDRLSGARALTLLKMERVR